MTYIEFVSAYNGTGNQRHHIIPRSTQRKKNGSVVDERVVYLSPAAHLYAHILYDIENGTYTSKYMRNVSGLNKKALTEITYEDCLVYNDIKAQQEQKISEAHKGKPHPHSEEWNEKISEAHKGKHHSDETKRRMSKAHGDNFKRIMSIAQKGSIWINNGIISGRVKKGEPIPEGWKLGRIWL